MTSFVTHGIEATRGGLPVSRIRVSLASWPTGQILILFDTLAALRRRENQVIVPSQDPELIARAIKDYSIDFAMTSPALLNALAEMEGRIDLSSLRRIVFGGTTMSRHTGQAILRMLSKNGGQLMIIYGSTEMGIISSWIHEGADDVNTKYVGRVLGDVEVQIRDLMTGDISAPGQSGRLLVKSPGMFKGYLGLPKTTRETIVEGGWVVSGDLVYSDDERQNLWFAGREKEALKVHEMQVLPADFEYWMHNDLGHVIKEVFVVGKPDDKAGEVPCLFLSLHSPEEPFDPGMVHEVVARRLNPVNKLVGGVQVLEKLPRNAVGKIDIIALREIAAGS